MKLPRILRPAIAAAAALPLAMAALTLPATASAAGAADADASGQTDSTAKALPTAQINGVVWDQAVVGNTVYVAGDFTEARPAGAAAGTDETARTDLLAYDLSTGELISDFAPVLTGAARTLAVSADKKTLYVGGDFDKVNGEWHSRMAAFDLTKGHGELISSFKPMFGTTVNAIDVSGNTVYAGGAFNKVNGVARAKLAAVDATTGDLLDWTATAAGTNAQVYALRVSPDGTKVAVGGSFQTLNSSSNPGYGLGLLDASTGSLLATQANSYVRNAGTYGAIKDIEVDANGFYGAAYSQSVSQANLEGTFKADWDGNLTWVEPCHGDSYSILPDDDQVYVASHSHSCETIGGFSDYTWTDSTGTTQTRYQRGVAFTNSADTTISSTGHGSYYDWSTTGYKSPSLLTWYPDLTAGTYTGMNQAAYDITASGDYLLMAGEFTKADGTTQQGLVRYLKRSAGKSHAPEGTASDLALKATSAVPGSVSLSYTPTWDRDNSSLTYTLYRDDETEPVDTRTLSQSFWNLTAQTLTDKGVSAGDHTYRLVVSDADGNTLEATASVTVPATSSLSAYDTRSVELGASHLWTFDETSGSTLTDIVSGDDMTAGSGITLGADGARTGSKAGTYSGASSALTTSSATDGDITTFTMDTWVKTSSGLGGPIAGYVSGTSKDRLLYMDLYGRIRFGVYPNAVKTIQSSTGYNDGKWHNIVATLGAKGMHLYIDGAEVASDTSVTSAQDFNGTWETGAFPTSGWPGSVWSSSLAGSIDGLTVYPSQLTADQISKHYALSGDAAPTASFTAAPSDLTVGVDASASKDSDGTIASYAWDFGDGSTGTGATATHTYAKAGTYTVTLTVTDDLGATSTSTQKVTVTHANEAPTASFTSAVTDLAASVDASASADPDGTIASYAWDFGDGSTGSGETASHTYAKAGTYTVTLTVTDNEGATSTESQSIDVTEPVKANEAPTASFTSTTSDLVAAFDGSASKDADGSIASYAWDFGDGSTGSGETASHTYAKAGTYTVTLTVTDNDGATSTSSQDVTVTAPADDAAVLAKDAFGRTATSSWGSADKGGDWTVGLLKKYFSVTGSAGVIAQSTKGWTSTAALKGVSSSSAEAAADFQLSQAPTGGGQYLMVYPRQTDSGSYGVKVHVLASGEVDAILTRTVSGTETVLSTTRLGQTWSAGQTIHVRAQAVGTGTTALQAKVWLGDTEPDAWTAATTDTASALQAAGWVGLGTYLTGSATSTTGTVSVTGFTARSIAG